MVRATGMQRILASLKKYKRGRTKTQLMDETGSINIGARILELREAGNIILTIMETGHNRFGDIVKYARYKLVL